MGMDARTDNTCENSDHSRPSRGSKKVLRSMQGSNNQSPNVCTVVRVNFEGTEKTAMGHLDGFSREIFSSSQIEKEIFSHIKETQFVQEKVISGIH